MPVKVQGLDKLHSATSAFGVKLQARLVLAVQKTDEDVRDTAKEIVHKDTHSLEETITAEEVVVDGDVVIGMVTAGGHGGVNPKTGKEVDYAKPLEYGTSRNPPYPYMRPSVEQHREAHLARVKQAYELTKEECFNE